MLKNGIVLLIICSILSCKSTKKAKSYQKIKKLSTESILIGHQNAKLKFKTFKASVKASVIADDREENVTIDLRIDHSKTIWMSIKKFGISGAKLRITPNNVSYYNKLENHFFEGDFSLIKQFSGVELDYPQVESLLLGDLLFPFTPENTVSERIDSTYFLRPTKPMPTEEQYAYVNHKHFKIASQEISNPETFSIFTIEYLRYKKIKQYVPELISALFLQKNKQTKVILEYRNVSLDKELRLPFKIPNGYKKIILEK